MSPMQLQTLEDPNTESLLGACQPWIGDGVDNDGATTSKTAKKRSSSKCSLVHPCSILKHSRIPLLNRPTLTPLPQTPIFGQNNVSLFPVNHQSPQ